MRRWPEEREVQAQQWTFLAALTVFFVAILAVGLRAEFGPVGEWGCAWRVERGNATTPDLTGRSLEEARARLEDEQPCVALRLVGNPPPDGVPPVVRVQDPAAGAPLDRRTVDVVTE